MKTRSLTVPALVLLALGAGEAFAEPRPPLPAVSAMRIGNYGSPSVMVEGGEQLRALVRELNSLRGKSWRAGEPKIGCYATVVLLEKNRQVGLYRVRPEVIVERAVGKAQGSYTLEIAEGDAPRMARLLAEITPPKCD
jgi:hypothetical protein